jgi:putative Mg2+ transporter-C (MgtC) family protein
LVNAINRRPLDQASTEAIYEVRATTNTDDLDDAREVLRSALEAADYPVRDIEVIEREQGGTELVATLLGSTADPQELDSIVTRLEQHPLVQNAGWSLRTTD